jgi:hypothetical protein
VEAALFELEPEDIHLELDIHDWVEGCVP